MPGQHRAASAGGGLPVVDPATVSLIANIGGWVFSAVVLFSVVTGLVRGLLVPGFVLRREIERADKATEALEAMTKHEEMFSASLDTIADLISLIVRPVA
jgi:hypothetical protein